MGFIFQNPKLFKTPAIILKIDLYVSQTVSQKQFLFYVYLLYLFTNFQSYIIKYFSPRHRHITCKTVLTKNKNDKNKNICKISFLMTELI